MSTCYELFRKKMKEKRLRAGWTQQDLADEVNMHVTAINHMETGRREPRLTNACLIGEALELIDCHF